jgi:hypothetical protein
MCTQLVEMNKNSVLLILLNTLYFLIEQIYIVKIIINKNSTKYVKPFFEKAKSKKYKFIPISVPNRYKTFNKNIT